MEKACSEYMALSPVYFGKIYHYRVIVTNLHIHVFRASKYYPFAHHSPSRLKDLFYQRKLCKDDDDPNGLMHTYVLIKLEKKKYAIKNARII